MDTNKHTQGEWEFSDMSFSNDYTVVHIGCGDELLAIMDGTNKKRVLADARLMAAAPQMLEAMILVDIALTNLGTNENWKDHMVWGGLGDDVTETIEAHSSIREAIAKATNNNER